MRKRTIVVLVVVGLFGTVRAQKEEKSIAAGLFVAFPLQHVIYNVAEYKSSGGFEAIGQYNFTSKSSALIQMQLIRFAGHVYVGYYSNNTLRSYSFAFISLSLKGGYRYRFTRSGFYANALAGVETGRYYPLYRATGHLYVPVALCAGKRFTIKDAYFLDVGIDRVGDYVYRWNIKAVFSLIQRPGED
ncbi:MAG: hypothetical protein ICV84_19155 [Flavisolibacter sp.]|nr:hypothetical protein [Flavisolibacter sp.]